MKMSDLKARNDVVGEHMRESEYRAERDRTALARAVSIEVTRYRVEDRPSQRALARQRGIQQPAIARLESGDINPSVDTLSRLARELGIDSTSTSRVRDSGSAHKLRDRFGQRFARRSA
jgi:transcriptional regulator with XRE-family HTH domain